MLSLRDRKGLAGIGGGLLLLFFVLITTGSLAYLAWPTLFDHPAPLRFSAPISNIRSTVEMNWFTTCAARSFQFSAQSPITLSLCNHPWVTMVRLGDRLKEQGSNYVGFIASPPRFSAPVTRITTTVKTNALGTGTCAARNVQFATGSLVTLSICNNPWLTALRVGDRLKEEGSSSNLTYVGFVGPHPQ